MITFTLHTFICLFVAIKISISAALITFQVKSSALSERISMHNVLPSASPKKKKTKIAMSINTQKKLNTESDPHMFTSY